ncbi:LytTR family DNA-binding domain-containing protein [Pedobacter sp. MC2016-05]|uniref:LytR/AlgR family response regulator transcription factor n=1 Tax=Pedobacter sp. MC2016-05 TaxID=2994474 RepID=UPI0022483CEE|nr:LytTR family DNA-binding domain-containing protein [Pedobacter sp. MC2016-05]MCX2476963.1 LytTR family DNA-binding domain-containing protein [Pedobacter sp. MC2016-05]
MAENLNCMVVDDEPLALSLLSDYISKMPGLNLVRAVSNPLAAISYLKIEEIDLIFLDMQMPELNGIEFLNLLQKKCMVIVTTAYSEYALDGYNFEVIDYLLKPITMARFMVATEKATDRFKMNKALADTSISLNTNAVNHIFIKTENRIIKMNLSDIYYFEGARDYIVIHTEAEVILTLQSMKSIQQLLPAYQFIRVHKSYIVAFDKIKFIERNRISIKEKLIPITDTYKDNFFKRIGRDISSG